MNKIIKKKSPRAPSIPLDDAVERTIKVYDKERCHSAPIDVIAQHLGYKDSKNGAALTALASLKYYGLFDRFRDGFLSVSKDVEAFKFAPDNQIRALQVKKWLRTPPIFAELLDKYPGQLPSEATLKFDLIQMGFSPDAANSCLQSFLRSVTYAQYYDSGDTANNTADKESDSMTEPLNQREVAAPEKNPSKMPPSSCNEAVDQLDRIPIRLSGSRRAWIEIPAPFYEADKQRLKAHIDLLLTDDEEEE